MSEVIKKLNSKDDVITTTSNLSIDELEKAINYAADKYYNDEPVITDAVYDMLIDFLKSKSPKSKVLKNVGAKVKTKDKVNLDYYLGSMDKIKPPSNQLNIWSKKYKKPYNLSDKLDGISALITFRNDNSIKMFTRGTAIEGQDITSILKYLKNIPNIDTVKKYCKKNDINGNINVLAIRGELIIKDKTFEKNWADKLKNARNSVAGLVNSKTINPDLAMDTDFVAYEVVDPFYSIDKQYKILNELKFNVVHNKTINIDLTFDYLSDYLVERRKNSIYNIDGIIVTNCDQHERNVKDNPDYAFAFKDVLEDQKAVTKVIEIEWNVSKHGTINPTLILEPVSIGGVEIKRATGNHAKFIVDNVLGPGAKIEIIRSGDVIPKVQKVLKPASKPDLPKGKWHWNETKVDIVMDDISDNKDVLIKNIYFFFSSLEAKGLGEKNVAKIIDTGMDSILKILKAKEDDFLLVEGFKEKTATKLVESIKKSVTNISFAKLMSASNKLGQGIGEERMKTVLSTYPNLMTDYKKWSEKNFIDNIKKIDGWEDKTSTLLVSNFNDFVEFYNSIKEYITIKKEEKKVIKKGEFTDKIVVLTGFRDSELQLKIEEQGGKIGSSISKNTNILIVKDQSMIDEPTDKLRKAQELCIKIITKEKANKMF